MWKKAGRNLEELVASLERLLKTVEGTRIDSPASLRDIDTGRSREYDVLLTVPHGHHLVRTAIECRDRSRPVTVPQVEGYWAKCRRTGVDQAVIVSSRGFYKTALLKAKGLNIRCLGVAEAKSLDWVKVESLHLTGTDLIHTTWTAEISESAVAELPESFALIDAAGEPIPQSVLDRNVGSMLRQLNFEPTATGKRMEKFVFAPGEVRMQDKDGRILPLNALVAEATFRVFGQEEPFRLFDYRDAHKDEAIAEVAIARVKAGPLHGDFVLRQESAGETLSFVPDRPTAKTTTLRRPQNQRLNRTAGAGD